MTAVLQIEDLVVEFGAAGMPLRAVDGVSLRVEEGRALGLVGESGCGKSVTALAILRLLGSTAGRIAGGRIEYRGTNLLDLEEAKMRSIRGNRISMIFQEPMTCLNPVFTVGDQIAETVRVHQHVTRRVARERAVEMLHAVGIPAPDKRVDSYPHQLSGGMRQRVMIGIALACNPDLLIADEPTTALDVTVQAQILELLAGLRAQRGMALVLISHDLEVVTAVCDEVAVMYAGKVVERASTARLLEKPLHPYTSGLLQSRPREVPRGGDHRQRLRAIPGVVPALGSRLSGCAFRDRCERAVERCAVAFPPVEAVAGVEGHDLACYNPVGTPA